MEKIDELLRSFNDFKDRQTQAQEEFTRSQEEFTRSQQELSARFELLQKEVAAGQEETAQLVAKKLKKTPEYQFRRKGNEQQFKFNDAVSDSIQSASGLLDKVKPTSSQEITILKNAKEQLIEGTKAIEERQKLIRIADRSDYGWPVAEAYQRADELAADDISTKRLEDAVKSVEQKYRQKRKREEADRPRQPTWRPEPQPLYPAPPQPMVNFGGPPPPVYPVSQPPPYARPPGPRTRIPGPCFGCSQMGHLRANCPNKSTKPYPLEQLLTDGSTPCSMFPKGVGNNSCMPCVGTDSLCSKGTKSVDYGTYNDCVSCDTGHESSVGVDGVPQAQSLCNKGVDNVCCKLTTLEKGFKGDHKFSTSAGADSACYNANQVTLDSVTNVLDQGRTNSPEQALECPQPSNQFIIDDPLPVEDTHSTEDLDFGRFWELEQGSGQIMDVQGRLKAKSKFWEEVLEAPLPVREWVAEGYKLPFLSIPPSYCRANQRSALENTSFVSSAIAELLSNRCVKEIDYKPHICSPLSVVANSTGKLRLVLNLRYLNQYLLRDKFKYEDLRIAMQMFEPEDYMFTFDLKAGYHHVDVYKQHWDYLGFAWADGTTQRYYVFCVLPFGLSTACFVFTKLLRPLVKHWRSQGFKIVVYLDDGICATQGKANAERDSLSIQKDLCEAGFVTNLAKCKWTPSQQCTWLGFNIDLLLGKVSVPPEKISALQAQLALASTEDKLPPKYLASITGKIISMSVALGPVARLMTRGLYALINARQSWCEVMEISDNAKSELQFWLSEIQEFNGQNIWVGPSALRVVYTDASNTGYAGYTVQHGCHIAHGLWLPDEAAKSSTWREIRAVRMVLEALKAKLTNERVRWFTDNQNVVRILMVGSRKPDLQAEALAVFSISLAHHLHIEPEWVPRKNNETADYLSRIVDYDDWSLSQSTFKELDEHWGPHTVDRFASYYNTKLPRFNSRFWNPGSEAVDAFTCDWSEDNNWLCPPIYLIPRVIQHARNCRARGTLIVPEWLSAPFWPMLFPGGEPAPFILMIRILTASEFEITPGRLGSSLFKGIPNTNLLAICFQF